MKRPLILVALFWCIGILFFDINSFPWLIFYLFTVACGFALIYWFYGIKSTLFFAFMFVVSLYRTNGFELPKKDFGNKTLELSGTVQSVEQIKNYQKTLIRITDIKKTGLNKVEQNFNVFAYLSDYKKQTACAGEKITLIGKLILPQPQRNPGCFDEKKYFKTKNIDYKIFPTKVVNGNVENYFSYIAGKIKNKISEVYDSVLQPKQASIVKSMILADRTQLDDYTSELYKTAGIYHILAISGLHISIIAFIIVSLTKFLFKRHVSYYTTVLFLIFYCLLTNFSISTVRAVIMISIALLGNLIYRENDLLSSLSLAAFILMFLNPFCILDIGFQYSFGAIIGIATCTQPIERCFSILCRKFGLVKKLFDDYFIKKYLFASLAVSLVTYAITVYYFFYLTPYSFITNLFILPSVACVVITGILVGIIGLVNLNLANFLSGPIIFLLRFYEFVCKFFLCLPMSKILVGSVNLLLVIFYFVCLALFINMFSSFDNNFFVAKKRFLSIASIFVITIILVKIFPKSPEITMLDVGQGDSIVLDCCGTYIIDGGGKKSQEIGNGTGKNILFPFLNYRGKDYIDAVFVTHSDADHIIGIIELIGMKKIGKIYLPCTISQDYLTEKLLLEAKKFSVPVEYLHMGDVLSTQNIFKDKICFSCLYPFSNSKSTNNNDTSLVMNTDINNKKILLTGDLEKIGEQNILNAKISISTDIIKVAHHGSKTSSTLDFLKQTNARLAIISSGINNSYGHPHKETLDKLDKLNIPFLNTAESGAITIKICNNKMEVSSHVKTTNQTLKRR